MTEAEHRLLSIRTINGVTTWRCSCGGNGASRQAFAQGINPCDMLAQLDRERTRNESRR